MVILELVSESKHRSESFPQRCRIITHGDHEMPRPGVYNRPKICSPSVLEGEAEAPPKGVASCPRPSPLGRTSIERPGAGARTAGLSGTAATPKRMEIQKSRMASTAYRLFGHYTQAGDPNHRENGLAKLIVDTRLVRHCISASSVHLIFGTKTLRKSVCCSRSTCVTHFRLFDQGPVLNVLEELEHLPIGAESQNEDHKEGVRPAIKRSKGLV